MLIVGLDGADPDLVGAWAADGSLPHLARLMAVGGWGPLRSTIPPATLPAWTSLMTGVNPGAHGITDFWRRVPGSYRLEFVNATYRLRPSLWRLLSAAGKRVCAIGFPGTYPPEPIDGVLISGFDAPITTAIDPSFVHPPETYAEIRRAVGPYLMAGFQELRIGPGWHDAALAKLLRAARRRAEVAAYLLSREPWDCFAVHFGESDTVAHHFWAFHDPASPRHDPLCTSTGQAGRAADLGGAIHAVYRALDDALGRLLACAGDVGEAQTVLVVSDHGSGGSSDRVLYLNCWLEEQGWLRFAPPGPARAAGTAARSLGRLGSALPPSLQQWAFRGPLRPAVDRWESSRRLAGIDWTRTGAFSEEVNTLPAIWLNVRGREPQGTVEPGAEYEALRDEVLARLADWRNPDSGEPVVERAWRREELYTGPAVEHVPDVVLQPALDGGYAYTCLSSAGLPDRQAGPVRRLAPAERLGAKGASMNGSHRPEGVLILAGAGVRPAGPLAGAHILDVAPTVLTLAGVPVPAYFEGRTLVEGGEGDLSCDRRAARACATGAGDPAPEARPYTAAEAQAVADRLRGLGYRE